MALEPGQLSGRVVVAGHSCLDIIPSFGQGSSVPDPGKLVAVGPACIATGGAVPNVGIALHKLGVPVRLVSLIGEDLFGASLREQLKEAGAEIRLRSRRDLSTSYSIVLDPPGVDRSFLHCPGANDIFDPDSDVTDDDLAGAIALHFGYPPVMRRTFSDEGQSLARLFHRCREQGVLTSLDLCSPDAAVVNAIEWRKWFARVLPEVSLFSPSIDELRTLLRKPASEEVADIPQLAAEMLELGAGMICIKMGSRGIYLRQGEEEVWQSCLPANFVSATGSGDSTIAGLLTARLCGYPLRESARLACCVGACSVESPTATGSIPTWDRVLKKSEIGLALKP
jgi:sugar/nucleoside kinase (ribokinase family)